MKSPSKSSKSLKNVNVKGTIVHGDQGVHVRNPHNRKMLVNNQNLKYPQISSKLNNSLRTGKVEQIDNIGFGQAGITNGVKYVSLADEKGKNYKGYFKDIGNDPFMSGGWLLRQSIKLNDRKSGRQVTMKEEYADAKKMKDFGRETYRGHMMNREVATFTLAKALKMDHIPDATIRRMKVDGEEKLGLLVRDIREQFAEPGYVFDKAGSAPEGINRVADLQGKDKKIGDKLAFDLLIGNTDRHRNNQMVKYNRANRNDATMYCFDQGLTFPDSNKTYVNSDFGNQNAFQKGAGNVQLTPEFVQNFIDFLGGDDYDQFIKFVEDQIGTREADAFTERAAFIADAIFNKKKVKLTDSGFKQHFSGY